MNESTSRPSVAGAGASMIVAGPAGEAAISVPACGAGDGAYNLRPAALEACMPRILLGLSVWNVLFLTAVLIAAWTGAVSRQTHMLVGLFVVSFALLAHSLVFLHFLGTGASIKKAVAEHGLDYAYARRTREYKLKTFPLSLTAMLWTVAAGGVGGGIAVNAGEVWTILHRLLAPTALLVNIAAHWNELRWVVQNSAMIEEIDGILIRRAQDRSPPWEVV